MLIDAKDESKFIGKLVAKLGLTEKESEEVKKVVRSEGWKVICEKIWARDQINALLLCQSGPNSREFNDGMYEGIVYAEKSVESTVDPSKKETQPRSQRRRLQDKIGPHDIEPRYRSGSNPL